MPQTWWLVFGIAAHTLFAAFALAYATRAGYTRAQYIAQALLAALVPALGAVMVLSMAKDAVAALPPPDESRFDRNYTGEG
jgi:hypothetical protein